MARCAVGVFRTSGMKYICISLDQLIVRRGRAHRERNVGGMVD
jgi:hypothetical protein